MKAQVNQESHVRSIGVRELNLRRGPDILFESLDLDLERGKIIGLTGPNGSGKTSLALVLLQVLQDYQGELFFQLGDGSKIAYEESLVRKWVYYVFQNPDHQIVGTIVEDDVAFGAENHGIPEDRLRIQVREAIRQVDLEAYSKKNPTTLSGGQKQRLAIAGALAVGSLFLIFDEPTAMLDINGRLETLQFLRELAHDRNYSVLLISHLAAELIQCDELLVLNQGRLKKFDSPKEFYRSSLHEKFGLESDTQIILQELET